jgi:cytosine/uracil/thiamine/allantoin permease
MKGKATMAIFFALAGIAVIAFAADRAHSKHSTASSQKNSKLGRIHSASKLVPHALTMLVMVAHASEITRVVEHVSAVHVVTALGLFAVWAVTNAGSEEV